MPRCNPLPVLLRAVCLACLALTARSTPAAEDRVEFNRDIRPILSDTCFLCHGPDKNSRQAGLRLDFRDQALQAAESGVIPIVPGKPDESEIIRRIFSDDAGERMPPPDSHKKLTAKQKELFRRWVEEGAEYQPHWLYMPLARPAVPVVKQTEWPVNPIDHFILKRLERKAIVPSPETDRRTLLRRLSLDLTGLPPTPEEVAAFVADQSPNAYEKQVDRLLKSEHFGERMAAWWLDVARFTDTVGYHGDQNQRIYPYRDYVIAAFNGNKPFDQFTLEQLAGDLLPRPTTEQLVATGFNRLNMVTREGGAQAKEYLAKYGAERVRTVGTTWLGSTLGCAECHDHKFDPFTAEDFYSMQAFFADVKQWGVYSNFKSSPTPELVGFNNEYPFPPEIEVDDPWLQRRQAAAESDLAARWAAERQQVRTDESARGAFAKWQASMREYLDRHPDGWSVPTPTAEHHPPKTSKETPAPPLVSEDNVARITIQGGKGDQLRLVVDPELRQVASIRLELLPDQGEGAAMPSLPRQLIRLKTAVVGVDGKERNADYYFSDGSPKEPRYNSTVEQVGTTTGWLTSAKEATKPHTSVWLLNPPLSLQPGEKLALTVIADVSMVPVRVAVSPLAMNPPGRQLASTLREGLFAGEDDTAASSEDAAACVRTSSETSIETGPSLDEQTWLLSTAFDRKFFDDYVPLHRRVADCRMGRAYTMVTASTEPLTVRVLPRGNWLDESGPVVQPGVPHFLPGADLGDNRRLSRLDLAHWLCSPENPVTPRNISNRLWKALFGNALSNVVDDLGAQGEPPSHPELLDWLAVELRDNGWDVKRLIKTIVMSAAYRQSSTVRPELADIDPNNRLLAAQNPRRLEAEFVRDNALFIAGLLNLEMGGPSAHPYQPDGYYDNLQFPNRKYVADTNDQQWRRGVYMHWQRTFLHPMLANFDAPSREECTANRVVSNTPQQALTLLNDPSFTEAARFSAERLLASNRKTDEDRLELAFERTLARSPEPEERESLLAFLQSQRRQFTADRAAAEKAVHTGLAPAAQVDPVEAAAWMAVTRVLLNLHETITRY